ncbi:MAG: YoaK family protein [Verrucomicrobiota bacterium]
MKREPLGQSGARTVGQSLALTGVLAMTAGCVDAYAIIKMGTYVSFMSGNTTQGGSELGQFNWSGAWPALTAIGAFVCGSMVGHSFSYDKGGGMAHRMICGVSALLLAGYIFLSKGGLVGVGVSIAMLALSMGIMNAAASRVATQAVSLTFVTGTLNKIGGHLALALRGGELADSVGSWDTPLRRAMLLAGVWFSFLFGAMVSGYMAPRFGAVVLGLPVVVLLGLAVFWRRPGG